ncbi:MAG: primosomal protein N' [Patescibacteria group bacterium]
MIVEVIPTIRLPRNIGIFSYNVSKTMEQDIQIGQIVDINFRNRNVKGLVVKIQDTRHPVKFHNGAGKTQKKAKFQIPNLKNINKILYPQPLITENQIDLIQKISEYYAVSPSVVARSFVPSIPKKAKIDVKKYKAEKRNRQIKELFLWTNLNERDKKYLEIIKRNKDKQILILVPEIEQIDKMVKDLDLDEKNVFKVHSRLTSKVKYFKEWLDILSGKPKIVIGTKMSIVLPFTNLSTIILDSEHDWNHKQSDINPRYDSRKVAEWIAEKQKSRLIYSTSSPSMEISNSFKNTKLKKFNTKEFKIIDLNQEQEKGNYSFLSEDLISNIDETLKNKKQVFLLHNRKGLAGFVECEDCKYVFVCPECNISLVYYNETKKIHCHHCGFSTDVSPLCPKCSGPNIKFKSKGVEDIANKIKNIFKDKNILTLSKEDKKKNLDDVDILIGTQFALQKLDFKKIGLISFINFDQLIKYPDFRTEEKAFQMVSSLLAITQDTKFIIQTHSPDHIIFQSLKRNNLDMFYRSELKTRKELNYPPFSELVKIIFQDKSNSKAFFLSDQLVKKIKNKKLDLEILGPLPAYPRKVRGKFRYNIIIKINKKKLKDIYDLVPSDFVIDVDPEKLV